MAGFKRDVDLEIEDIETDVDDLDDFEEDDDDIINTVARGRGVGSTKSPRSQRQSDEDDGEVIRTRKPNKGDDKQMMFIVGGVIVVVLVIGIFFFVSSSKKKEAELLALQQQQQEEAVKNNSNTDTSVNPGIPSFSGIGADENDEYLYDPSLVTKDLNGNQVPTDYVVEDSNTVTDYITYKKYRAATGNGLEFYWLEAEYKGQPYKVQVPYSIYSKLDYSGITVVDMEVLDLEDGSQMVTYMEVRKDAKSLLEDN